MGAEDELSTGLVTKEERPMNKVLSASEVAGDFGAALRWAEENSEGLVVEYNGKPAAVLIAYDEYEEFQRLRRNANKQKALKIIREIRAEIQALGPPLSAEEAYRMAGFSEEVIQETLAADARLAGEVA